MDVVPRTEDVSKQLVEYREPCDMTALVVKASENLTDLVSQVNDLAEEKCYEISINKDVIDELISTLKALDSERIYLNESVESETIKSSVLRHKLSGYPRDIEGEIRDAVKSARRSNDATIKAYEELLQKTEKNISELEKQFEMFSVSNVTLDPEKQELKEKHESIVNVLNQTLADKAKMQIRLNETRVTLSDTLNRTADFEAAFRDLNEDMTLIRQESAGEKKRLKSHISDTRKKIEEQRKLNFLKRREVEEFQKKSGKQDEEMEAVMDSTETHQVSCEDLAVVVKQLTDQVDRQRKDNTSLIHAGKSLREDQVILVERYRDDKIKLSTDVTLLNNELHHAQYEYDNLQTQKIRAMHLLDAALLAGRKDKEEAEEMQKSLRNVKDDLLHQTSECTRLKRENLELEIVIETTKQDHIATTEVLYKQINDIQASLSSERKGRQLLQHKRDEISKESGDYFTDYNRFVGTTTKEINNGKLFHQNQSKKGKELQMSFKEAEEGIKRRQEYLIKAKETYVKLNKQLKNRATKLQKSIDNLEEELAKRTAQYNDDLPLFNELKEMHSRKAGDFESLKKHIVEIKSKKASLENTVTKKHEKLEKMEGPKDKVHEDLLAARKAYLEQVQEEGIGVRQMETEIYEATRKLETIKKHNKRFQEGNEFFETDNEFMKKEIESMDNGKREINLTIGQYRDWLEIQWRKHMALDKKYYNEDVLLLDDIKRVEQFTSVREKKIENIHRRMEEQLNLLSCFLEEASSMRPASINIVDVTS